MKLSVFPRYGCNDLKAIEMLRTWPLINCVFFSPSAFLLVSGFQPRLRQGGWNTCLGSISNPALQTREIKLVQIMLTLKNLKNCCCQPLNTL